MAGITLGVRINRAKLDEVIEKIPGAANYATELAADAVVAGAKERAPVRTGELKGSITKMGGGGNWFVTATAGHAGFVEFGTRFMSAQPYLRPASESIEWTHIITAFFRRIGL